MSEQRVSEANIGALFSTSDVEERASSLAIGVLYTELVAGHEMRASAGSLGILFTDPNTAGPIEPPECSFGSSFQPGVLKGQGVCE